MTSGYREARQKMVDEQLLRRGVRDHATLSVLMKVPRHMFVPEPLRSQAYADTALPLPVGQTVSQPYMVAVMTEALALVGEERVLEIGTGSGYQTAVLAELAAEVYTVERNPVLHEEARLLLEELGYGNIHFKHGDGTLGWPGAAPFDAILVTAGAPAVPKPLQQQLAEDGGRLVIPLGDRLGQELYLYTRLGTEMRREWITSCRFVPLTGQEGWSEEQV